VNRPGATKLVTLAEVPVWRWFLLGTCYAVVGRPANLTPMLGVANLQESVDFYSRLRAFKRGEREHLLPGGSGQPSA